MNSMPAIQSVGAGDPLLTAEEVAAKLQGQHGLGLGSFVAEIALSAGDPHERWSSALPRQRHRRISARAGTCLQFAAQTPVK